MSPVKDDSLQDPQRRSVATGPLVAEDLAEGWRRTGVTAGMHVVVHSSLSSLGPVEGGAAAVVASLRHVLGSAGTLVVPTFTPQVADPAPRTLGPPSAEVQVRRDAVPLFTADLPSSMGAIAEAVRLLPEAIRSRHPQASVAAVGARARAIVDDQPWHFAVGPESPFARILDLEGTILLIGVGHNRNSFLHHAESLTTARRLKQRRFPVLVNNERVWWETIDVGDDNNTHFPVVGSDFERVAEVQAVTVGAARVVLLSARPFVRFAVRRLTELLRPG
jgi:aminoglycoside 3-N-acetyltransferase